jgi:hypothetical protein
MENIFGFYTVISVSFRRNLTALCYFQILKLVIEAASTLYVGVHAHTEISVCPLQPPPPPLAHLTRL